MKKLDVDQWVRPNIRDLKAYSSARDEFSGEDFVFLDANESPFNSDVNRYPDPYQSELKESISAIKNVETGKIFLGNGSDEAIDLLIRCFVEPGDEAVLSISPSYGMYKVCSDINGVEFRTVLLEDDFSLNPDALLGGVRANTKVIFLCSPNNPSGNALDRQSVIRVLEGFKGLVVIDEAYQDFSEKEGFLGMLGDYQNLVVLQTFSKAWGMAGARLGMAFADESIIAYLNKVKYPYNVNSLSQAFVYDAITERNEVEGRISLIVRERKRIEAAFMEIGGIMQVFPSDANFILIKVNNPREVYSKMLDKGIVIRDRSTVPLCEGCLRITIGTPEENDQMLSVLSQLL